MVFFTCDACGASLKKNQVEKHYLHQCRRCSVLTCIDCQKDFPGDSYKEHIRCISEEEKYSAKGWQPKASANKGLKKQEAWMDNIRSVIDERGSNLDNDVRRLLETIVKFDNIPRKRNKFVNFVQNALGKRTPTATIDKTWEVFEEAIKPKAAEKNVEEDADEAKLDDESKHDDPSDFSFSNGDTSGKKKKKKKDKKNAKDGDKEDNEVKEETAEAMETTADEEEHIENQGVKMFRGTKSILNGEAGGTDNRKGKRKRAEEDEEMAEPEVKRKSKPEVEDEEAEESSGVDENHPKKFDWEMNIRNLLAKKGSMKVKRLKKKVVDEYVRQHGDTVKTRIQLEQKVEKKLKKNKAIKYVKETVSLATSRD